MFATGVAFLSFLILCATYLRLLMYMEITLQTFELSLYVKNCLTLNCRVFSLNAVVRNS